MWDGTISHLLENLKSIRLTKWIQEIHIFRLEEGQESCWEKILFSSFALPVYATHDTGAKHFSNSPQTHGRRGPLTPHELDRLTELGSNIIKPLMFGAPCFYKIHLNMRTKSVCLCDWEWGKWGMSAALLWPILVECVNNRRKSFKAETTSY